MDSMLRRLVAAWIKSQDVSARRAPSAKVRCELLEDRQLLSTATLFRGSPVMGFSVGAGRTGQTAAALRGTMNGPQGSIHVQNANGSVLGASEAGQAGGLRANGYTLWGGANRGGLGARNGLRGPTQKLKVNNFAAVAPPTQTMLSIDSNVPADSASQATDPVTLAALSGSSDVAVTSGAVDVQAAPQGAWGGVSAALDSWTPGGFGDREPVTLGLSTLPARPGGGGFGLGAAPGRFDLQEPSDEVKNAFDKLQTDMQAIQDKSEVTPKLLAAVRNDLDAIQQASTTDPDQSVLDALNSSLETLDGQFPTAEQQAQIVADFKAVLQSQGIADETLINQTIADVEALAAASHVTADDLATIAADHEAIQAAIEAEANTRTETPDVKPDGAAATFDAVGSLVAGLTGGLGGAATAIPFGGGVFSDAIQIQTAPSGNLGAPPAINVNGPIHGFSTTTALADGGAAGRFDVAPVMFAAPGGGQGRSFGQFGGRMMGGFGGPGA